jgi:basic amino acid/polyamine antiporter, APA family
MEALLHNLYKERKYSRIVLYPTEFAVFRQTNTIEKNRTVEETKPKAGNKLFRGLSLLDASMLIIGSMIGSGIFIVSADIAKEVGTPGLLLLSWVVAAIITIFGALSYGELAAAMPKAGGQYVFLKEAYNKLMAFLYGWTLFAVIQTGTIAAVGVGFAKFTGVFWGDISKDNHLLEIGDFSISTQQLLGIIVIWLLTLSNFRAVKSSAILQNLFTFLKIASLVGLIAIGIWVGLNTEGSISHFKPVLPGTITLATIGIFFAALNGSLFAADAWNNVTFAAAEVNNPQRNLPRALLIGTGTVMVLYLLANIAYLAVLPIAEIINAPERRVATLMMQKVLGNMGMYIMAGVVMISTFGCLNGIIMAGARVYYAMAKDGLFFKPAAKLNNNHVPANALIFQAIWASLLALSGSYGDLLGYVMFAVMLFYIFTIAGIFILRRTKPDMPRPYKAVGYPVIPALYILLALAFCVSLLVYMDYALYGLIIVLAGVPLYYLAGGFRKQNNVE